MRIMHEFTLLIYKVSDIMVAGEDNAVVQEGTSMKDTIIEISKKGLGMVSVVDEHQHLRGIVTNGDLRRQLDEGMDIYALRVEDVMIQLPVYLNLPFVNSGCDQSHIAGVYFAHYLSTV